MRGEAAREAWWQVGVGHRAVRGAGRLEPIDSGPEIIGGVNAQEDVAPFLMMTVPLQRSSIATVLALAAGAISPNHGTTVYLNETGPTCESLPRGHHCAPIPFLSVFVP